MGKTRSAELSHVSGEPTSSKNTSSARYLCGLSGKIQYEQITKTKVGSGKSCEHFVMRMTMLGSVYLDVR